MAQKIAERKLKRFLFAVGRLHSLAVVGSLWPRVRVTFGANLPTLPDPPATVRRPHGYVDCMASQDELVDRLVGDGWLKKPHCIEAFRKVDRKNYLDDAVPSTLAYHDRPLPNGLFETISAPHMHATALELLGDKLKPGAHILDVGSGSGYLTAAFAYACGSDSYVLGVEKHKDLVLGSIKNILKVDGELLKTKQVELRYGNALGELETEGRQFDAIHVGAAAAKLPRNLCRMLKPDGLMMVPVGAQGDTQVLTLVRRVPDEEDGYETKDIMHVQYVPLTPPE